MSAPNLFVVGTTKGGTSTLYLWLSQHPGIALSDPKELHFWCRCPNPRLRRASSLEAYEGYIPSARCSGEASPCYLYYPDIASTLKARYPDARILVSLRDPASRFWSHYLMNEIYRPTGLSPERVLDRNLSEGRTNALDDLFGMGLYASQVERFHQEFGRDAVHVTFLEEMGQNGDRVVADVVSFLGLDQAEINTGVRDKQYVEPRGTIGRLTLRHPTVRKVGVKAIPPAARRFLRTRVLGDPNKKPSLDPGLRNRLQELYADDSRDLEELLGRTLPWSWHRA